jgi:dihydrofolate reductase
MNAPKHALVDIGSSLLADYFAPPSTDEMPILKVEAFWAGESYFFERAANNTDWVRVCNG